MASFVIQKSVAIILLDRKCCPSCHTWWGRFEHAKFSTDKKIKDLDCALLKRLSNCHCWILYRRFKILY